MPKKYTLDELRSLSAKAKADMFISKDCRLTQKLNLLEKQIKELKDNPPSSIDELYDEIEKIDKPIGIILGKTLGELEAIGVSKNYLDSIRKSCDRIEEIIDNLNSKYIASRISTIFPEVEKRNERISYVPCTTEVYPESLFYR
ncbi:MAG: hypothetical protein WC867_01710 [Candidatus Pacearchaeota archaeon]|jgi:hypothetical protein